MSRRAVSCTLFGLGATRQLGKGAPCQSPANVNGTLPPVNLEIPFPTSLMKAARTASEAAEGT